MSREFDVASLLLPIEAVDKSLNKSAMKSKGRPFIYRVDVPWMLAVLKLGLPVTRMALAILQCANLHRVLCGTKCFFKLHPKLCRKFDLDRPAVSRALVKLESANLLEVHRQRGAAPLVRVILPERDHS